LVKKGQEVAWCTYALHHRPDIYGEDADEFVPERFKSIHPGWGFTPFGGGPRVCIGQQKALFETAFVTVRMLQEFKHVESRDNMPWQEEIKTMITSKHGVKIALYRYLPQETESDN
jgi:cytochrome P450